MLSTKTKISNQGYELCSLLAAKMNLIYPEAGVSFGYIGNLSTSYDDRDWRFFTKIQDPKDPVNRFCFGGGATDELEKLFERANEKLESFLHKALGLPEKESRAYFDRAKAFESFKESPAAWQSLYDWVERADPDQFHFGDIDRAMDAAIREIKHAPDGWKPATSETRQDHYNAIYQKIGSSEMIILRNEEEKFVPVLKDSVLAPTRTVEQAAKAVESMASAMLARTLSQIDEETPSPKYRP